MKKKVKQLIKKIPLVEKYLWGNHLYHFYFNSHKISKRRYWLKFYNDIEYIGEQKSKCIQLKLLIRDIRITPVDNDSFFYSIDCFKTLSTKYHIFDNYSIDYSEIVNNSLENIKNQLESKKSDYAKKEIEFIDILHNYLQRCKYDQQIYDRYKKGIDAIESLFYRPADSLFEALQRILFYNQIIWQTGHKNNGLGHLDWILNDLYVRDIENGRITEAEAEQYLVEFFKVLHENCWYKSNMLLGDTGQIIIVGGLQKDGIYHYNQLTYKFIEVSKKLGLPDPKVLLRCSAKMPYNLLKTAIECIATGIGAPFLSNDDIVVPSLISFGYDAKDAYNYVTSACWEPLIINCSCDQNNLYTLNFALPLIEMMDATEFDEIRSMDELLNVYKLYFSDYLKKNISPLTELQFEEDPVLSLFSLSSRERETDIVRGGAKYSNIGLTSVGMSTVVNSFLNIQKYVFDEKKYTLKQMNLSRKNNFQDEDTIARDIKSNTNIYGRDEKSVIDMTKIISDIASKELIKYHTKYGGKFKFGLSSPNYVIDGKNTGAALDGRRENEPFPVHISCSKPIANTELFSFASQLDYSGNRLNGNVVDFIVAPSFLKNNIDKFCLLLMGAIKSGIYQMQMNVTDSLTLIDAKNNPEKYPNLVVRVWGFSAYFNDLPEEYKDVLIKRTIESEKSLA